MRRTLDYKRRRPPGFPWAAFRRASRRLWGFRLGLGLRVKLRDGGAIQEALAGFGGR